MPLIDHSKCANTLETGLITFYCTKKHNHSGKHGTRWKARNLGAGTRMVSISWPQASVVTGEKK